MDFSTLVTIIVVTSPVASNPSTELIDRCLASIVGVFPALRASKMVIAADGALQDETIALKRRRKRVFGKAGSDTLLRYYDLLDKLASRSWLTVDRPTITNDEDPNDLSTEWLGFALTLKKAIYYHVQTPYVFVTPHDYELIAETLEDVAVEDLFKAFQDFPNLNYVGFPNAKTLTFQQRHQKTMEGLRPIDLDSSKSITLLPLGLWKENPHFAATKAYQDFVFSNGMHRLKRGHFIEDTLGQQMLNQLKSAQSIDEKRQTFHRFGTYILQSELACTNHINGISYSDATMRKSLGHSQAKSSEQKSIEAAISFVKSMKNDL
jgi:hypothetical protein